MKKVLFSEDKLDLLRRASHGAEWESLDEKRSCILCERTFSGRQVVVTKTSGGRVQLKCPTPDCAGTPREWVHTGNPLLSGDAWKDWERLLSGDLAATRRAVIQ